MAFDNDYLARTGDGGLGAAEFAYKTDDGKATVDAANYFADTWGKLRVGDSIAVTVVATLGADPEVVVTSYTLVILTSTRNAVTVITGLETQDTGVVLAGNVTGRVLDSEAVLKATTYTVSITADSGKTFYITADTVFTLPSIATGANYTFVNWAADGDTLLTIAPAAVDAISYKGTSVDDKDLILTKATSIKGDRVTLASFDGTDHWQVADVAGLWVKE